VRGLLAANPSRRRGGDKPASQRATFGAFRLCPVRDCRCWLASLIRKILHRRGSRVLRLLTQATRIGSNHLTRCAARRHLGDRACESVVQDASDASPGLERQMQPADIPANRREPCGKSSKARARLDSQRRV